MGYYVSKYTAEQRGTYKSYDLFFQGHTLQWHI